MQITQASYAKNNNPKNLPVYNGIPTVKAANVKEGYAQWELEEYQKCKASPEYFIEKYIILEGEGGSENFKLYDYQKDAIQDIKENRYSIILAPRRAGKSFCILGYLCWFAIFHTSKNVYVLSKTHDDSKFLLSKLKAMYQTLPFFLQPGVDNYAVERVDLSNGTKLITAPSTGVRGDHADVLLADEFAFLPNSNKFWTATYPLVAKRKNAKVIITSTPNGMGNEFYNQWDAAVKRISHFVPIRWFWNKVPGYDESFKQETIANIGLEAWDTEFECKFLTASRTLITGDVLQRMQPQTPIKVYGGGTCNVYEEPQDFHKYILSIDVSDGVGKDSSVISIVDITNKPYKLCAVYRNNRVSPFELDTIAVNWAKKYNNGFIVIETNSRGADVANRVLYEHNYENIFIRDPLKPNGLGIDMKEGIKRKGCVTLKNLIETNMLEIYDDATIKELSRFEITNTGGYAGANGSHDDTVMGLVIFAIFTGMPIFQDIQGSDRDINETIREIRVASLPQDLLTNAFCTNYNDPYEMMNNMGSLYRLGNNGGDYDGCNYYVNDWE